MSDIEKLAQGNSAHWIALVRSARLLLDAIPYEEQRGSAEMERFCLIVDAQEAMLKTGTVRERVKVILFKPSGKYYTEEEWRIPEGAIGPHDMVRSPDFRRISGGPVLIETQEPWGFPCLFPGLTTD